MCLRAVVLVVLGERIFLLFASCLWREGDVDHVGSHLGLSRPSCPQYCGRAFSLEQRFKYHCALTGFGVIVVILSSDHCTGIGIFVVSPKQLCAD